MGTNKNVDSTPIKVRWRVEEIVDIKVGMRDKKISSILDDGKDKDSLPKKSNFDREKSID